MTRLLLVFLFSCPLVAHPQANAAKDSSLVASNERSPVPASIAASSTSTSPSNAAAPGKISRLVVPKLVHIVFMKDNGNQHFHVEGRERVVMVQLTVNELGLPTDLHIPEPAEEALDTQILAAVGKFRYEPGTLDGKPTPMTVRIHYVVAVGAIY